MRRREQRLEIFIWTLQHDSLNPLSLRGRGPFEANVNVSVYLENLILERHTWWVLSLLSECACGS